MTDDELMILIQAGTTEAFGEIVSRYQGMLFGFFLRNTRDAQLSEDLAQETLLKVYNHAWDYLPLGHFKSWLFRIARNLMIDDVRRRTNDALIQAIKHQPQTDDDALGRLAEQILPPEETVEFQEFQALVDELIVEVPDDQRQTFILHHYAELSLPEVAEIMDVPLATSKSRLRLAREKLAEKLRARGIGPQPWREAD